MNGRVSQINYSDFEIIFKKSLTSEITNSNILHSNIKKLGNFRSNWIRIHQKAKRQIYSCEY